MVRWVWISRMDKIGTYTTFSSIGFNVKPEGAGKAGRNHQDWSKSTARTRASSVDLKDAHFKISGSA
jgi:hypothetical protein